MRSAFDEVWRPALGLAVAGALIAAAALWTDLEPRVDESFFFDTGDAALAQAGRIGALFERHGEIVVVAAAPDLAAESYWDRIAELEEALLQLPGVLGAHSLASGPSDLEDARASPLWRRLLLAADGSASHLLLMVEDPWPERLIPALEDALARHARPDFALSMAGIPPTVHAMQLRLARDFAVFSAVAVAGFGLVSLALFRSLRVALGVLAACSAAVALTFLALQAAGGALGLLSANLVTIVFVLTQSHLIFLTSNWQRAAQEQASPPVQQALATTLTASLGSMATTLLGFGTLLLVDAKPLRELGLGGVIGGGAAFAVAYLLYPLFLSRRSDAAPPSSEAGRAERWWTRPHPAVAAGLALACLAAGLGLVRLDTDPSLLAYFDEDGDIHRTLAYLDRNAGSAPLELVLRRADGQALLEADDGYRELWSVQQRLEAEPTVGRIVSLPVVLAEGERFPLAFLISKRWMLRLLETPLFDGVGSRFVSEDHRHTLFALQMVEGRRDAPRVEVVERLRAIAAAEGFEVPLAGGVYYLQGRLSELVARSMLQSLGALALLFVAIAWLATGSLRVAACMAALLAVAPLAVFGGMGLVGVPVDVVTAPAASIGLGLAADAMLHLAVSVRARAAGAAAFGREAWRAGLAAQWRGVLRVSAVVALGFALFAFSGFPPTRRFGLAVAAATALAAPLALLVLPRLAARRG